MKKHRILLSILYIVSSLAAQAEEVTLRLKNTLGFDRVEEYVSVAVPEGVDAAQCQLTDERGKAVAFEAADGQLRWRATVPRLGTAVYTLTEGTPKTPKKQTFAAVMQPTSRADVAWENDLAAYRVYSYKLQSSTEPNTANGVDLWQKKQATPVIEKMYGLSNYHNESQYGVDAYSVNGKRLGCGGVSPVVGGKLLMHNAYDEAVIDENGLLHSQATTIYNKVSVNGRQYKKTVKIETVAGGLLNRATLRMEPEDGTAADEALRMAVAIYQHTDMSGQFNGVAYTPGRGLIGWAENPTEGSVTSAGARFFAGACVPGVETETEVIDHHLCLTFDYQPGTEVPYYFGGGWNIFPAGAYSSDEEWFDALTRFAQTVEHPLALTGMTELPTKDEALAALNLANQYWQQQNPTHGDYFWNRAVYHVGNIYAYDATGDHAYLDYSRAWAEQNGWWGARGADKSRWKYKEYSEGADYVLFGDNQICFQIYADLYNRCDDAEDKWLDRMKEVMSYQVSTDAVDYWWWVDGLFMVMPIMTRMYQLTGDQLYLDKMHDYWQYCNSIMWDEEEGLYYRDGKYVYPAHKTQAGGKDFWARGDGWAFAVLARMLEEVPQTDPHYSAYLEKYLRMAASLKQCQQPAGHWSRSLLDERQAPGYETSGTALNTFAYAWGIRKGVLSEVDYGMTLQKAWHYLTHTALQPDGLVGYVQPIGENASPGTTIGIRSTADFGVGAFLMACAEMSRLGVGDTPLTPLRLSKATLSADGTLATLSFNAPLTAEAADASHYHIEQLIIDNGELIIPTTATLTGDREVQLLFEEPLDYGRWQLSVEGLTGADGAQLAPDQQRLLLRTVPVEAKQTGITITAIGSQSGNPYSNVNDGKLTTRWSQEGTKQWIQFDLKKPCSVTAVDVAFYQGTTRQSYFDILVSTDKKTWTTAMEGLASSGLTDEMERYRLPEGTVCRYVRLSCNGNSQAGNNWNSITEARIRYDEIVEDGIEDLTIDQFAIEQLNGELSNGKSPNGKSYDLTGRPVLPRQRGIYIRNGRVVVK